MEKYIPPHRRATSSGLTSPQNAPLNFQLDDDPFVCHFILASPVYRTWRATKTQYGADPVVDKKFRFGREAQRKGIESPTDTLSTVFKNQFKAAMEDVNFQAHGVLSNRVNTFLDLGCAPGGFSQWILEHNPAAKGMGITMTLREHGLPMLMEDWRADERCRYELWLGNLVHLPHTFHSRIKEIFVGGHCSLVICGARYRDEKSMLTREMNPSTYDPSPRDKLELSQLLIAFQVLEPGGTLILLASLKLSPRTVDALVFLRGHFEMLTPTKGTRLHGTRSSYYLVCQGFKGDDISRMQAITRLEEAIQNLDGRTGSDTRLFMQSHGGDEMDLARGETEFVVDHFEPLWKHQTEAMTQDLERLKGKPKGGPPRPLCGDVNTNFGQKQ